MGMFKVASKLRDSQLAKRKRDLAEEMYFVMECYRSNSYATYVAHANCIGPNVDGSDRRCLNCKVADSLIAKVNK